MSRQPIDVIRDALVGRTVVSVDAASYEVTDDDVAAIAEYPRLMLDDGSEVVLMDGWGGAPICEVEHAGDH